MKRVCSLGLILLSTLILRAESTVGIYGGVNKPGQYSLSEGQGAISLLHQAGGYSIGCGDNPLQVIVTDTAGDKTIYKLDTRTIIDSGRDVQLPANCTVMVSQCAGILGFKPELTHQEVNAAIESFVSLAPKRLQTLRDATSSTQKEANPSTQNH